MKKFLSIIMILLFFVTNTSFLKANQANTALNIRVSLSISNFHCYKTTEKGADEIYFLVIGKSPNGLEYGRKIGPFNMNENGSLNKKGGDSNIVDSSFTGQLVENFDFSPGQKWDFFIFIMEQDGGTTETPQKIAAGILSKIEDPYLQAAGAMLNLLTIFGLKATDTDDAIGTFDVKWDNDSNFGLPKWKPVDRCKLVQSSGLGADFEFNGDGSKYTGRFIISGDPTNSSIPIDVTKADKFQSLGPCTTPFPPNSICSKPGSSQYSATYSIDAPFSGYFNLITDYASGEPRPMILEVNGKEIRKIMGGTTPTFLAPKRFDEQVIFSLKKGKNVIRVFSDSGVPHFQGLVVVPIGLNPNSPPKN